MSGMKYNRREKLKIAKEHVIDGVSLDELSKKYNYSISIIKYQSLLFIKHGEKAFEECSYRTYTRNQKLQVIKRVYSGEAAYSIAIELGLPDPTIIRDWLRLYKKYGESAIKDTRSREAYKHHDDRVLLKEYKKLLQDLEETKAENEYLKKSFPQALKRSKQFKKK